jgi:hypothetical protein
VKSFVAFVFIIWKINPKSCASFGPAQNGLSIRNQKSKMEVSMSDVERLKNYINGVWCESAATTYVDVQNPATAEVLARTPFSPPWRR